MVQLYGTNEAFRQDALDTTKTVLKTKLEKEIDLDQAAKEAVHYLLKELAFVLVSPVLFQVPRTVYIYHHEWPVFEKLVNGVYDSIPKEKVGFLLVKELE